VNRPGANCRAQTVLIRLGSAEPVVPAAMRGALITGFL